MQPSTISQSFPMNEPSSFTRFTTGTSRYVALDLGCAPRAAAAQAAQRAETVYLAYASDGSFAELVKGVEWLAEARELEPWTPWVAPWVIKVCKEGRLGGWVG